MLDTLLGMGRAELKEHDLFLGSSQHSERSGLDKAGSVLRKDRKAFIDRCAEEGLTLPERPQKNPSKSQEEVMLDLNFKGQVPVTLGESKEQMDRCR